MLPIIGIIAELNEVRHMWNTVKWAHRIDSLQSIYAKIKDSDDDKLARKSDQLQAEITTLWKNRSGRLDSYDKYSPGQDLYLLLMIKAIADPINSVRPLNPIDNTAVWDVFMDFLNDDRYQSVHQDGASWTGLVTDLLMDKLFGNLRFNIPSSILEKITAVYQGGTLDQSLVLDMLRNVNGMGIFANEIRIHSPTYAKGIELLMIYLQKQPFHLTDSIVAASRALGGKINPTQSVFGKAYYHVRSLEKQQTLTKVTSKNVKISMLTFPEQLPISREIAKPHIVHFDQSDLDSYKDAKLKHGNTAATLLLTPDKNQPGFLNVGEDDVTYQPYHIENF